MNRKIIIKGAILWVAHFLFTLIVLSETVEAIAKPIPAFLYVLAHLIMMIAFFFLVYHTVKCFTYLQNNLK